MKRLLSTLLLALLLLTSCGGPGPEKTVEAFFAAAKTLDTQAMASLILPSNTQTIEDLKGFLKEEEDDIFTNSFREYFTQAAAEITHRVVETKVEGDKAKVTVEGTYVDSGTLLSDVFNELFRRAFEISFGGGEITPESQEIMFKEIIKDLIPQTLESNATKTFTVDLVKYEKQWYFDEISQEMMDVLSAGFVSAANKLDFFGGFDEEEVEEDN